MTDEIQQKLTFTVSNLEKEIKIRDYLIKFLGFSVSLIAKVKYDRVILNGIPVHMRAIVKNGDVIEVIFPGEESENINPKEIPLEIIFEDEHILAVNKPTNMPVHPSRGNSLPTLAEAVRAYLNRPFVFRAVNRLDRDTSGIVLIAKNQLASAKLSNAMKNKLFSKKYIALVKGVPKNNEGIICAPIDREAEGSIKRVVCENGKDCTTGYKVLDVNEMGNAICEITLFTGRTHQIRVHLAHIGHPLYNDFLYGVKEAEGTYFLHCNELSFPHPVTNKILTLHAPCDFYTPSKLSKTI